MTNRIKVKKSVQKEALGLINKPQKAKPGKQRYERIACVFQGGGALGAYQAGAFRAIHESGYTPNYLAGVSIGAINSAIIAGNPREKQIDKLLEFWNEVTPKIGLELFDYNHCSLTRHLHNYMGALHSLWFGIKGFFKPRPFSPLFLTQSTPDYLSYYDSAELRQTLERLIDFDRINDKNLTLILGAVNVASGEMEFFNNQKTPITTEHVLASAALPPALPAIKINDGYYWDGGIYANTPLVTVLDALPQQDTLCFVVDCFALKGDLPKDMDQVEERQKDIRYASHSRRLTNVYTSRQNLQAAISYLSQKLKPEAKANPEVQRILKLGHEKRFSVVHIIYDGTPFSHSFKDYNFYQSAIKLRLKTGYNNARDILQNPEWEKKSNKKLACSIYGVPSDYFDQR